MPVPWSIVRLVLDAFEWQCEGWHKILYSIFLMPSLSLAKLFIATGNRPTFNKLRRGSQPWCLSEAVDLFRWLAVTDMLLTGHNWQ